MPFYAVKSKSGHGAAVRMESNGAVNACSRKLSLLAGCGENAQNHCDAGNPAECVGTQTGLSEPRVTVLTSSRDNNQSRPSSRPPNPKAFASRRREHTDCRVQTETLLSAITSGTAVPYRRSNPRGRRLNGSKNLPFGQHPVSKVPKNIIDIPKEVGRRFLRCKII
jgi:hypothetical protein